MSSNTHSATKAESALIKAHQDQMSAQVQEAKAKLDLLEATARQKKAQAEIDSINLLMSARHNLDGRIRDLKTTHNTNVTRAKAEIAADVVKFKSSVDELAARLKNRTAGK
jgi:hypothetical protein